MPEILFREEGTEEGTEHLFPAHEAVGSPESDGAFQVATVAD